MTAWLRERWFSVTSTLVALWLCAPSLHAFGRIAAARLNESYALGWLEPLFYRGALAAHQGLPLYPPPSLEYTPAIYNPGLSVVGGWLIATMGEGYPALRWFSLLCFVGLAVVIAWWTWRETQSPALAIVAVTLLVSLQAPMGRWITAINVDTPGLFFGFLGLLLATRATLTPVHTIIAGLCITLGFAFKQPMCLLAIPALAHLLWTDRRQALRFAIACGGSALLLVGTLMIASDGWYWTYAVTIPFHTPKRIEPPFFATMLDKHRLATHAAIVVAPLLTVFGPARLRGFWLPLLAVAFLMAQAGFTKDGGELNALWPVYVTGGLCLSLVPIAVADIKEPRLQSIALMFAIALTTIGGGVAAADKLTWFRHRALGLERQAHNPKASPHTYPGDQRFEQKLRDTIRRLPKPVFVGARFFGPRGPLNTHQTGLYEGLVRTQLFDPRMLEPTLQRHHYKSLLLWSYWNNKTFDRLVRRFYVRGERVGADPLIGLHVHVWLPKQRP